MIAKNYYCRDNRSFEGFITKGSFFVVYNEIFLLTKFVYGGRPTTQCVYNAYETPANRSFVHVTVWFQIDLTLFLKRNRFPVCTVWKHNSCRL